MRKVARRTCAAVLLLALASSAAAQPAQPQPQPQPQPIALKASEAFRHRHSRLELPPTVAGIARTRALGLEGDQLDVLVDYMSPDESEEFTFYVYRNVAGALPVWFDRAGWMIEHRFPPGTAILHGAAAPFVPPGRSEAAGLAAVYDLSRGAFRSTGVVLVPLGEWYVKLRASSKTLPAAELEARMRAALAELRWPKALPPAPAAIPVAPCTTALALAGEAKPAKGDKLGASNLFNALLGVAAADTAKKKGAREPVREAVWCRDAAQTLQSGVYRADGATDAYLLALGDAGRAAWAGPDSGLAILLADEKAKPDKPSYLAKLLLLSRVLTTQAYDRLPAPDQALRIVEEGHFASAIPTWGKAKGNIEINSDALK